MAEYKWPEADKRSWIGKRVSRLDGPDKVSGKAKYTYDINRPGMLYAKILRSPHAHAKIVKIDTSQAEKMPGVKSIKIMHAEGEEIFWAGAEIVALAAVDEPTAEDAVRAIKVLYEKLPHLVIDNDPKSAGDRAQPTAENVTGDPDKGFKEADVVIEGDYGVPVITHCCLESHGSVSEWDDKNHQTVYISTQGVSTVATQMGGLKVPASDIHVHMDHVGGGFGSKFTVDTWNIAAAELSRDAGGKAVKLMLERAPELEVAGCRPSSYAHVKIGAKKDGTLVAWESHSWGTGGIGGGGTPPMPYLFQIPNVRKQNTSIQTNIGSARAWRAPNHPQGALITMSAIEDLAATLEMDPLEFFLKNIELTGQRADVYREELAKAAELIDWKKNWHPRGDKTAGPIKRGLGVSIHTWGGGGHDGNCDLVVHPDGSVEVKSGSQDLGTGTRTAIAIVAADTLGLPLEAIKVEIGDNTYPADGGSGGSTTIGAVSAWTRRAAVDALNELFAKVARTLDAKPEELEAWQGHIRVASNPARSITWAQACSKLGGTSITARGKTRGPGNLTNSGVGGAQMADVSVDVETGVVRINKVVAVQDCGLVINLKLAESQCYGALIMGIGYSLYEEKIMDQNTGQMLNPNMEFYKLAGIGDVGELVVHLMTGKGYDERGVIGLGEPPVISPGACISNAVANAIGVRVPYLPLTPDRVLEALAKKGGDHARV
ncbi:MAG TPA: xanthine dehydrogenase family protein molybdopterin-binding subunit [Blastocatellia bacterium]|nr:xanthine dehydrogenase family protein molybdopterin-binding subunit [Blastocatellia bacterium]